MIVLLLFLLFILLLIVSPRTDKKHVEKKETPNVIPPVNIVDIEKKTEVENNGIPKTDTRYFKRTIGFGVEKKVENPVLRTGYSRYIDKARGIHSNYRELLGFPEWEGKRRRILIRDDMKCTICGKDYDLNVHHKYYSKVNVGGKGIPCDPWDYPDDALVTLCKDCHGKEHGRRNIKTYWRPRDVHYS